MMRRAVFFCLALVLSGSVSQSQAALVNWNIDSSASFLRLNLPVNTTTTLEGVTVNVRLRNADNSTWSDAGGRRSFFSGTMATNYKEAEWSSGNSLSFLSGQHNANSINFGSFRPDPASFDPGNTNAANPNGQYSGSSGAPASFAVRINVNALVVVNATVGYLALRDLEYDAGGSAALSGSAGNLNAPGGSFNFGIQDGILDLDANDIGLGLGQLLADERGASLGSLLGGLGLQANLGALTITNLGGFDRRLDQVINIPISIAVDQTVITGSIQGQLRAFATVPEPSSLCLVGLCATVFGIQRRRRKESSMP